MKKGIYSWASNPTDLIRRVRGQKPQLADELSQLELDWYRIVDKTDEKDEAEIFVYAAIGGWYGVEASDFVKELNDITASNIKVRINSPGGDVYDSIAIYNALEQHPANKTVFVDSLAASGASVIAMAGDKIIMMPGSQMMIHDASGIEIGNAQEMRAFADFLDGQSQNIAGFYATKAGGTSEEWRERMLAETWMFAQEAVNMGLADEVYSKTSDDDKEPADTDKADDVLAVRAKMKFKHPLANRGFNYAGRSRAPEPTPVASANKKTIEEMTDAEFTQHLIDMAGSR